MRRRRTSQVGCIKVLSGLLICLTVLGSTSAAQRTTDLTDSELAEALRGGGHVIYFRHAATDASQPDEVDAAGSWTSCDPTRMRQLSEEGRATSRAVGEAIRALDVPIGQVLASEYCRTVETAQLMALGPVETTRDIINMNVANYVGGRAHLINTTRRRLATPPQPGTNTLLVSHGLVLEAAADVYLSEGEAAIFEPLGNEGFRFVARVSPENWGSLAETVVQ